jgi:microcystin-dependent protein
VPSQAQAEDGANTTEYSWTPQRVHQAAKRAVAAGTVQVYIGSSAPSGWLLLNGDSIGSAASGADQASDDYEALFVLLWDSIADPQAPVSGGRGVSAPADWAANKTLTMPDARGRTLIGTGTGLGLTARAHGDTDGEEVHMQTESEVAVHGHQYRKSVSTGNIQSDGGFISATGGGSVNTYSAYTGVPSNTNGQQIGRNQVTSNQTAFNVMQPWLALNWIVRY